jgi:hypothetical protein
MPFAALITDVAGSVQPMALLPLALSTAGEANGALPLGLEMADLQRWTLIYLGLSSLAFVAVWVVGFLRR